MIQPLVCISITHGNLANIYWKQMKENLPTASVSPFSYIVYYTSNSPLLLINRDSYIACVFIRFPLLKESLLIFLNSVMCHFLSPMLNMLVAVFKISRKTLLRVDSSILRLEHFCYSTLHFCIPIELNGTYF